MKRFVAHIIYYNKTVLLCCLLTVVCCLLTGCHDHLVLPEDEPQPRAEQERTVIVYMAGDNTLTLQVRKDTAEMALAANLIPEDVNFIIYLDDRLHKPAIYELSAQNGMKLWKQFDQELCSTDPQIMLQTLQEIERFFPARHYGLTLWSHATGWTSRRKTFGEDDNGKTTTTQNEMEIPELHSVLSQLPKTDYIFFDACFMQCIEVAYELRDVTDYIIGSPAEIPGPGAPYDKILSALATADVQDIVQGYQSAYPGTYDRVYYSGVLLSLIDCSKLETLAQATGQLITPFYMEKAEPMTSGFQSYCSDWTSKSYLFDMQTTMHQLLSEEDYAAWLTAFQEAVPLATHSAPDESGQITWFAHLCENPRLLNPDCYGGVTMFQPMAKYEAFGLNLDFQQTAWYQATGWQATGW